MEVQIPEVKISQTIIYGIAAGAAIIAIVLWFENSKMRKELMQYASKQSKKPCNCDEAAPKSPGNYVQQMAQAERLNTQPMPVQSPDDPNHPPEVVL
jgi:hypothetical protein